MPPVSIAHTCAMAGIAAGRAIRTAVYAIPLEDRARPVASHLKARNVFVDAKAEEIGLEHLRALAARLESRLLLLVDDAGTVEPLGGVTSDAAIWVSFDAIDGTKKLAGTGPQAPGRLAAANDGAWAATFAFTEPTIKSFAELTLGDFSTAAIVDGNPTRFRSYPRDVIAYSTPGGRIALDAEDGTRRIYTTTCEVLSQCWAFLDSFQAYDRDTSAEGDEELAVELYRTLINRHAEHGAHDILRQFGSLSALCRTMLGWRQKVWLESQGGAFFVVNENLPNLIPSIPIIAGAGGISVDFDGQALLARRLAEGRTSVVHAANATLCAQALRAIAAARA